MEYKDYYKTLGVEKNASESEIKRAYRKLAMQYHPDRNPGNKKAEEKFKEINEANQVLGDPSKRARYDQLGNSYSQWQQGGGTPTGFNWEDWFSNAPGRNVRVEEGNLEDLLGGDFSDFFSRIFGGARPMPGQQASRRANRRARSTYQHPVEISLTEAYNGTTRLIAIEDRRLEVKIPRGAATGTKVRVADAVTGSDGQKTDLYLVLNVTADPQFERRSDDLYTDVQIGLYTAVLGGELAVPTPSGNVVLTIPAGTQPDQVFRLTGRGMPHLKKPDVFGDLYVRLKVRIPRQLTARQKQLFEELERL
jgi:curved DNA-binding protein